MAIGRMARLGGGVVVLVRVDVSSNLYESLVVCCVGVVQMVQWMMQSFHCFFRNPPAARCVAADPRHGEKWTAVSKNPANAHKDTEAVLKEVAAAIGREERQSAAAAGS